VKPPQYTEDVESFFREF